LWSSMRSGTSSSHFGKLMGFHGFRGCEQRVFLVT
jgi:hypothetical protein